ncbi:helix-turn-helix domain-containing protein [Dorea amylophila]
MDTLIHLLDGKRITPDSIAALCEALNCQPGDLLEYVPDTEATERDTE